MCTIYAFSFSDEPPEVTNHPESLSNVFPGKPVTFTAEATGTGPLNYHWEWKPAEEEGGSSNWQPCHAEWSDCATLTIPSVQKSNEGSYRCVISNYAGSQTSKPAKLEVVKFLPAICCLDDSITLVHCSELKICNFDCHLEMPKLFCFCIF